MSRMGLRAAWAAVAWVLACWPATAGADLTGHWEGAIRLPGTELGVAIDFTAGDDGSWSGQIDIPMQGATDLPLNSIELDGASARFSIEGVPGDPTFSGTLSEDGGTLAGDFTQGGQTFPFELTRTSSDAVLEPEIDPAEALAGFEEWVTAAMEDWHLPGLAIAVVKGDELVYARGFGLRDVENGLAVDADTLFAIGSASKAFTATVVAMLVQEGLLDWETPVVEYLPGFRLHDPVASAGMTARDLLCHRSGLPRHDVLWYATPFTRAELVERLRYIEPNAGFREKFQYQNLMFMTAGYLAGQVSGSTWEQLVRERIFEPLGMERSNFSVEISKGDENAAQPYSLKEIDSDEIELIPFRNIDAVGPAGSINSSVTEMAQWLRLQINGGEVDGRRVIAESALRELHAPIMVVGGSSQISSLFSFDEAPYMMYGMGWFIQPYRGFDLIQHGGGIDGFITLVSFMPKERLGVVVLTNMGGQLLPTAVTFNVYDRLLGLEPVDWNARFKLAFSQVRAQAEAAEQNAELDRRHDTRPSHELAEYAGRYEHPAYGQVEVAAGESGLRGSYYGESSPLEHWHYDVFRLSDGLLENTKVTFRMNGSGDIDALSVSLEASVDEIVFRRLPPQELRDPAYLARYVGEYDLAGVEISVGLRGQTLTLSVPGQPTYTLEPVRRHEFALAEVEGYRVRFTVAGDSVTELLSIQPNGVFKAVRTSE